MQGPVMWCLENGFGSSGSLALSSLSGSNGFVLPGVAAVVVAISVSGAGDINGDGVADLIIGAPDTNSDAGVSYVVFGKPGLGSTGSIHAIEFEWQQWVCPARSGRQW